MTEKRIIKYMIYTPKDVARFGTILGIWAHPDDEVFAAGGLLASAAANGQRVILITASDGAAGETSDEVQWPKDELSKIRKKELENSLVKLGEIEHHWLGCEDGKLEEKNIAQCVEKITEIVKSKTIDTVVTFESTGITGHPDHIAVHKWANEIAKKTKAKQLLYATENRDFYDSFGRIMDKQFNVYFKVDKPKTVSCKDADVCVVLDDTFASKKYDALLEHKSQTAQLNHTDFGRKALLAMCRKECFELKVL